MPKQNRRKKKREEMKKTGSLTTEESGPRWLFSRLEIMDTGSSRIRTPIIQHFQGQTVSLPQSLQSTCYQILQSVSVVTSVPLNCSPGRFSFLAPLKTMAHLPLHGSTQVSFHEVASDLTCLSQTASRSIVHCAWMCQLSPRAG